MGRAGLEGPKEDAMKLSDLIELFVIDGENARAPGENEPGREHRDNSSLADIARILRELDGQYELDQEGR
jgi:hypothetical protein